MSSKLLKVKDLDFSKILSLHSQQENSKNKRDNRYIRVSSIPFCKRKIGYSLLGYQGIPNTSHSLFTLDLGNMIHDQIQKKLVNLGWIKAKPYMKKDGNIDWKQLDDPLSGCELEVIDHNLRIIGHTDGITVPLSKIENQVTGEVDFIPDYVNGERYIIEIKSITDKSRFWCLGIRDGGTNVIDDSKSEFIDLDRKHEKNGLQQRLSRYSHSRKVISDNYGTKVCPVYKVSIDNKDELVTVLMIGNSLGSFSSLKEPKQEHITQASLYGDCFNISKILFIYVGKDVDTSTYLDREDIFNIPFKIFEHTIDDLDIDLIKNKITDIYNKVDNKELPDRDFFLEDEKGECRFCEFRWQCYPQSVDVSKVNQQLISANLKPLKPGPNVVHKYKKNLSRSNM